MSLGAALLAEALATWTPWIALAFTLAVVATRSDRRRVRMASFFLVAHILAVLTASALRAFESNVYGDVHLIAVLCGALVVVSSLCAVLFHWVLPKIRVSTPQIVQDVSVAGISLVVLLFVASRNGFNLSSIVATSAVLTAVVGLSLQDTLGNILGGIALQTDESIKVGDWIEVGGVVGRVANIHWRYTAVETRDWETVVVPNSVLLKNQVKVLGRRSGHPKALRRTVHFNVDYRFTPARVLQAVEEALLAEPILNVATQPKPYVLLREFNESWAKYGVRYWLTDLSVDDVTDSTIRKRIYFALSRAEIPLSIPAQTLFVTQDTKERRADKQEADTQKKRQVINSIELFAPLTAADRELLAGSLQFAPFTRGEALTQQGATANWLYIIERGECSVRVEVNGTQQEVAILRAGDFMGEMSLFTGAPRAATVIAQTEVACWKLGHQQFKALLDKRPELAEPVAEMLAQRQNQLDLVKTHLDNQASQAKLAESKHDLADKIRSFFGIEHH